MSEPGKERNGRVWDPLVRLFHWTLAAAFATAWFIRSEASIHETAGKTVLVLVMLRTAWGLVGPASARFETFIKGPLTTFRYVISILRGRPAHYPGHNPAGAAMIGALLLLLTTTAVSGMLMTTTAFWGGVWIERVHGTAATFTVFLIAGHLLGVLAACVQHRENLPLSMMTGRKTISVNTEPFLGPAMFTRRRNLAALALIAMGFGVWAASSSVLNAGIWRMPKIIAAAAKKGGCEVETVSGPHLVIYPAMEVRYEVIYAEGAGSGTAAVPTNVALQKRPQIDVSELVQACQIAVAAKSGTGFGFAEGVVASYKSVAEAAQSVAVSLSAQQNAAIAGQRGADLAPEASANGADLPEAMTAEQSTGAAAIATVPSALKSAVAASTADRATAPAAPLQSGKEGAKLIVKMPALKAPAAKSRAAIIKKAAPDRAKSAKPIVRKLKSKAVAAIPIKKKALRKIARHKKIEAWRALTSSSSRSGNAENSHDDGHGSGSNSGSGSGNSGSGSNNSGSGSSNSGSGSGNSGSGGGGGD
jgi:cytochrome b